MIYTARVEFYKGGPLVLLELDREDEPAFRVLHHGEEGRPPLGDVETDYRLMTMAGHMLAVALDGGKEPVRRRAVGGGVVYEWRGRMAEDLPFFTVSSEEPPPDWIGEWINIRLMQASLES
jgi:hypothetical protein